LLEAQFPTDRKKTGGIFEIFGAHFNLFPTELPTEKLAYKTTPLPHLVHFFLLALISISSPLRLSLVFERDFIVLVVVLNILKGMQSFFFIFVFLFYFNYHYFFGVLCFVYCL
jgi:hypothetical protein